MEITIETISPADAKELLAANVNNRALREHTIREYAVAMQRDEWLLTGDPINFDTHGDLINGQHRLHACVRSGVPFITAVARNVDPRTFRVIDSGLKRQVSDLARQIGFAQPAMIAAATKLVIAYRAGTVGNNRETQVLASRTACLQEAANHRELYNAAAKLAETAKRRGAVPAGFAAFCVLAEQVNGPGSADEFIQGMITGADLSENDPRLAMGRLQVGPYRPTTGAIYLGAIIRAYQAFVAGETRKQIMRWQPPAVFPVFPELAKPKRVAAYEQARRDKR
jgi:hypothetical protein